MDPKPKKQPVATAPAKLKLTLEPRVFNAELSQVVGENKVGYTTDEHIRLVEGIIPKLMDENGEAPKLDQEHWDRLRLIFRPTEDLQRAVLRQTFADAGYTLDTNAEQALVLLFNAPQFADFLAKTVNEETSKPFIVREKKRGIKKSTFAALISAGGGTEAGN